VHVKLRVAALHLTLPADDLPLPLCWQPRQGEESDSRRGDGAPRDSVQRRTWQRRSKQPGQGRNTSAESRRGEEDGAEIPRVLLKRFGGRQTACSHSTRRCLPSRQARHAALAFGLNTVPASRVGITGAGGSYAVQRSSADERRDRALWRDQSATRRRQDGGARTLPSSRVHLMGQGGVKCTRPPNRASVGSMARPTAFATERSEEGTVVRT
jgi:hypothetical protein